MTNLVKSFLTTPIFYVNGAPHLGHLYTLLLTDAQHRYQQLLTNPSPPSTSTHSQSQSHHHHGVHIFSTGTDEHGLKVQQAAAASASATGQQQGATGTSPSPSTTSIKSYCDSISNQFQSLLTNYNISNTDFIRTTEPRHIDTVTRFWKSLQDKNLIYEANYEGWYSILDETFVPSSQVTDKKSELSGETIKVCSETGNMVQWTSEVNYKFRLENYKDEIQRWLLKENPVQPAQFVPIILKWLESVQDLSISRPASRSSWGIPVPNDPSQIIYVWMDALVNYLTVAGTYSSSAGAAKNSCWPPTTQVVGKDILKFHSIYWPGFLLGADLQLPSKILCHSHWTVNNVKMSKSLGNVVDPLLLGEKYGVEAVRYFLLREGVPHSDGNFNEEKLIQLVNVELADTLGNLLSRCTAKALNPAQIWPKFNPNDYDSLSSVNGAKLRDSVEGLPGKVESAYADFNFYRGLEHIMGTLRLANVFVQDTEPWKLVKLSPNHPSLLAMTCLVLETLRVAGIMLQPIIPHLSSQLLNKLNVGMEARQWTHIKPFVWEEGPGYDVKDHRQLETQNLILFSRIKTKSIL